MPSLEALLMFLGCVVVASILQNLTAFAFGLVLLGLVELLGIVPLADATNASMVLALVNSLVFIWRERQPLPWGQVKHVLWASTIAVPTGLWPQVWLSANAVVWLTPRHKVIQATHGEWALGESIDSAAHGQVVLATQ